MKPIDAISHRPNVGLGQLMLMNGYLYRDRGHNDRPGSRNYTPGPKLKEAEGARRIQHWLAESVTNDAEIPLRKRLSLVRFLNSWRGANLSREVYNLIPKTNVEARALSPATPPPAMGGKPHIPSPSMIARQSLTELRDSSLLKLGRRKKMLDYILERYERTGMPESDPECRRKM